MSSPASRFAAPVVVTLFSAAGLWFLWALANAGWPGQPTICLDEIICYCEATVRGGRTRQPVNTWSNLASFPVAIAVAVDACRARARVVRQLGFAFALAIVAQGLGSIAFHASLTVGGAIADAVGMFVVLGLLLATTAVRARRLSLVAALSSWAGVVVVALAYRLFVAPVMAPLFLVVCGAILVAEHRLRRSARASSPALHAGLAAFAVGAVAWTLSLRPGWPLCRDGFALQGHGIWHVCAAAAVGLLWIHTRSDLVTRG